LSSCQPENPINCILLEEGYYRLNPAITVLTDVAIFAAYYERGRRLQKEGKMADAAAEYEKAVQLYRDDYLIEDLYEDWTLVERERLSNLYMDMLTHLATRYLERGRFQESIQACYQLLEKDCCHENSYRLLVQCYAQLGFHGRASRQYGLFENMLKRNCGMEPSPHTRAVFENALRSTSALRQSKLSNAPQTKDSTVRLQ
jgi:LuxR family transcriptional regulator, maltose regulon positive regulatory protein